MDTLISVIVGGVLTFFGGFFAVWYQAEVAARTAKGNRLRDIYHPMLAATRMAEAFAKSDVAELFDENGVMTAETREQERKKLEELLGRLKTATESASWLEFESDKIAVHLRQSLSGLQRLLTAYGLQLFRDQFYDEKGVTQTRSKSEKEAISKVCFSLGAILVTHIRQLERSPLRVAHEKAMRRFEKKQRQFRIWRIRWRLRFHAWRQRRRYSTIENEVKAKLQAKKRDQTETSACE